MFYFNELDTKDHFANYIKKNHDTDRISRGLLCRPINYRSHAMNLRSHRLQDRDGGRRLHQAALTRKMVELQQSRYLAGFMKVVRKII